MRVKNSKQVIRDCMKFAVGIIVSLIAGSWSVNGASSKDSDNTFLFTANNDTISQCIAVSIIEDNKVVFKLNSHNKLRNITEEISGIAVNQYANFGTSETDEDEQGNLYPVLEYIYEGKCWLAFRFDTKFTMLNIKEADNDNPNLYCPFESIGTLKRSPNAYESKYSTNGKVKSIAERRGGAWETLERYDSEGNKE